MITSHTVKQGNDFLIAQQVVDYLEEFFPGWEWTACSEKGVIYFKNLTISQGWCIQLLHVNLSKRLVLEKGSEFLDRFNMPYKYDAASVNNAPVDFTGAMKSDKWTQDRRYYNRHTKTWKAAI